MSEQDTEQSVDQEVVVDELATLKARADQMGISYHPSIGLEKLREKVNAYLAAENPEPEAPAVVEGAPVETEAERRQRKRREANELVRVRVTCMNPAKAEWEGEIFTAGNSLVGSFTKYVPFNADEGWHVPRIILNQILQRQCQIFTTVRDSRGNATRKGKLIKEFAVEIMEPLTAEELAELARRQAAQRSVE